MSAVTLRMRENDRNNEHSRGLLRAGNVLGLTGEGDYTVTL